MQNQGTHSILGLRIDSQLLRLNFGYFWSTWYPNKFISLNTKYINSERIFFLDKHKMNQVNQRPWNCCWGLLWILCSPRAGNCWIPLLFRPCTPLRFGKDCKKNKKQKTEKLYCFKTNIKNIPNARVPSDEKRNNGLHVSEGLITKCCLEN